MNRSLENLSTVQKIVLAIDTSNPDDAEYFTQMAADHGAKFVKFGLQYESATSWDDCSDLADKYNLSWIADAKLGDTPNTVEQAVLNLVKKDLPPSIITVHTKSGNQQMQRAYVASRDSLIFGVTEETTIPPDETLRRFQMQRPDLVHKLARNAIGAGLAGVVTSAPDLLVIKNDPMTKNLKTLVPGTRSVGISHGGQNNVTSPAQALEQGADLLVIGRQITRASMPEIAYANLLKEIA